MKYYAGYESPNTEDVAMFLTEKERDAWVNDRYSLFKRICLTEKEALRIVGSGYILHTDESDDRIIWLINEQNII